METALQVAIKTALADSSQGQSGHEEPDSVTTPGDKEEPEAGACREDGYRGGGPPGEVREQLLRRAGVCVLKRLQQK